MVAARRALSLWGVRSPVLLLLSLVTAVVTAPAQELASPPPTELAPAMDFEGRIIGRIEFDPPDQPLPRAELEKLLPFHAGSTLHLADIRTAIQTLYLEPAASPISWSTGRRSKMARWFLQIATQLTYFVSGVTFLGVPEPPNKGQLTTATKLELGAPFVENSLQQATENVMERLRANSLYQSTVKYSVERRPDTEEIEIHFTVDPGMRARFDGVQVSGDFNKSPENIIRDTRWHRRFWFLTFSGWREATERRVQDGVNRVRQDIQSGDRLEAQVTLGGLDYHAATNTVTPSLKIDSGPIVQVRTAGANIPNGRLRQLIPVFQERTVDRALLVEGQRNLVEYLQSQGYFEAAVDFDEVKAENGREVIDYRISRKDRFILANIGISGNHFFDADSIRERLEMRPAAFLLSRYGRYSQKLLDRDLDTLRDLYRSNGFRDAQVTAMTSDNYKGKPGQLAVELDVQEGPQWLVSKLELEGFDAAEIAYVRSLLESTEGQPFSDVSVAIDRDIILNYFSNNGYPDAAFDWSQMPGAAPHTVELHYVIQPGRHEIVRSVLIRGLDRTRPSLVTKRIRPARRGIRYPQSRIADSQQRLYDLGVFSKVEMAIQNPMGDEDSKAVCWSAPMKRTCIPSTSAAALNWDALEAASPLSTNRPAPPASSRAFPLGVGRASTLQWAWPRTHQSSRHAFRRLSNARCLSYLLLRSSDITTEPGAHDFRPVRQFPRHPHLRRAAMGRIRPACAAPLAPIQLSVPLHVPPGQPHQPGGRFAELIPLFSQPDKNGQLSMSFVQDRRDDPINSTRGMYNTVDAGIALKQFGSDSVFTRVLMRNSTYHPLGRRVVIARTLQFGYIQRLGGLSEIPLAERFFAGGAASNRAFPDNQAGPRDLETGFPLGGSALLLHSTELRFPLIGDNLGGVLFHDMGNVYNDVQDVNLRFRQRNLQDFGYMVHSFGFGFRYRTPIGPLRADFSLSPDAPRFFGFAGHGTGIARGHGEADDAKRSTHSNPIFRWGSTFRMRPRLDPREPAAGRVQRPGRRRSTALPCPWVSR